jgi:hypothetical protein
MPKKSRISEPSLGSLHTYLYPTGISWAPKACFPSFKTLYPSLTPKEYDEMEAKYIAVSDCLELVESRWEGDSQSRIQLGAESYTALPAGAMGLHV